MSEQRTIETEVARLRYWLENIWAMREDIHTLGNARAHARQALSGAAPGQWGVPCLEKRDE